MSSKFPVVKTAEEALAVLRSGSGVGLDLTHLSKEEAQAILEQVRAYYERT